MDEVDIAVLGGLFQTTSKFGTRGMFKGSFKGIANELNLDEDTIRKRVRALQNCGVLKGWELYLDPSAFGCSVHALRIDVDLKSNRDDMLRRIRMVHGVLAIGETLSQTIVVFVISKTEESFRKSLGLILEITGGSLLFSYEHSPFGSHLHLSPTDWRAIRALRKKPTCSYKELGRAIGLSSRAAKRRMEKLISAKVITITPLVDFKAMRGAVPVDMLVSYTNPVLKESLDAKIASRLGRFSLRIGLGGRNHSHYTFAVLGAAQAKEISDWVRTLEGIEATKVDFLYDLVGFPDAYDELIPNGLEQGAAN